jgi:hypothetical protein
VRPARGTFALALALLAIAAGGCGGSSGGGSNDGSNGRFTAGTGAYILGSWHGQLRQKGMSDFSVIAVVRSLTDASRNTVSYTGIRCSGNWTYRGYSGGAYRFHEVIGRGSGGSCKGQGTVTLQPTGRYTVRYEFRGGGVVSRGTLKRES